MGLSDKLEIFPGFSIILESSAYHVEDHWAAFAGRISHRAGVDQPAGLIAFTLQCTVPEERMDVLNPVAITKHMCSAIEASVGGVVESVHWCRKSWGKISKGVHFD